MAESLQAQAAGRPEENQLVTFNLGSEEFGFDIMSVQEIIRQPVLSRVPVAPDYVEGIANLRGTVLPVIDTRTRFGMKREADTDRTRVLVVDVNGVKTGLRVDRVRQVTRIQRDDVEAPPAVIRDGMRSDYLQGVVKLDGGKRIIMSLNPAAICRVELGKGADAAERPREASAEAAGSLRAGAQDQSITQVVSFKLGAEEFAFPMERVREILRVERPSEVPDTPPYFLGILTVRGNILPVIDLRVMLGLPTFADDVRASIDGARARYGSWADALDARVDGAGGGDPGLRGGEDLKAWQAGFATSSQSLMETLGAIRTANDRAMRGLQQSRELPPDTTARAHHGKEVGPFAREVLRLLEVLRGQIAESIRDDERLVVVQTRGALLALLVDKVREVLNVPTRLIDPPPSLGGRRSHELRGVARLDEGRRLIMLLDADQLARGDGLRDAIQRTGIDDPGEGTDMASSGGARAGGAATGERQFVTFRLADGEYGIPISEIQEIDRFSKMTRIPRSADCVDGVTNLRGEVIPVINGRRRFNLEPAGSDERTRVIILDVAGRKTGLVVDSVREVLSLAPKDIAPPPPSLSADIDRQCISGVGKVDDGKRMIVLLNVAAVVDADRA